MADLLLSTRFANLADSLLTYNDYAALAGSGTISDLFSALSTSALARYVADVPSQTPESILNACKLRISHVINTLLLDCSAGPLYDWVRLLQHRFMIDNVCLVLLAVIRNATADADALLADTHPAGHFPGLAGVATCATLADAIVYIHETTPLGRYFAPPPASAAPPTPSSVEELRTAATSRWLEAVLAAAERLGEQTFRDLGESLYAEADRMSLSIALGRAGALAQSDGETPEALSTRLMPRLGRLHPAGQVDLLRCDTMDAVKTTAEACPELRAALAAAAATPGLLADDAFVAAEAADLRPVLASQQSAAPAYAWIRLAEIEARNLAWIAECIVAGQPDSAMPAVAV